MAILVKNLRGTSSKKLPAGFTSWFDVLVARSNWRPVMCLNIDCFNVATKGGHVIKKNTDKTEYLVPICTSCNNEHDKEFYVDEIDLIAIHE